MYNNRDNRKIWIISLTIIVPRKSVIVTPLVSSCTQEVRDTTAMNRPVSKIKHTVQIVFFYYTNYFRL